MLPRTAAAGGTPLPRSDNDKLRQELQEARRHIERLEESLIDSQRLATVGQLACCVVHEFNNLLLLIIGRAGEALKYGDAAAKEKALHKAVECGQRAADIAAAMLGYATSRQTEVQLVAADDLMDSAVNLIAWDLPKRGIELVRDYETDSKVRVVAGKMEQVLLNLILNARTAMRGRGGRLTVSVTPADTRDFVALRVRDTGCGIPKEHLERIFDPFFTTRERAGGNGDGRRDGGAGLGLPVARDIVRHAGGDIQVESAPGAGATFTVVLPVAK
ncbi:MAG: HAMP domain-containing histidine kinase [Planctomycetes bacterium]|nr:HAMP domain-containing histidine kinase [Planctomycetota bacterium]